LTLPIPAPDPLPDLIILVTSLVIRNVMSIARNIHIIGCSVKSARPTGILALGGALILTGTAARDASFTARILRFAAGRRLRLHIVVREK
jgi:hypothetical protein